MRDLVLAPFNPNTMNPRSLSSEPTQKHHNIDHMILILERENDIDHEIKGRNYKNTADRQ